MLDIARKLRRSLPAVVDVLRREFPLVSDPRPWDADLRALFVIRYGAVAPEDVARSLRIPLAQLDEEVARRRREPHVGDWSPDEDALLKIVYGTRTQDALEVVFQRRSEDIEARAAGFTLKKDKRFMARAFVGSTVMPRWTDAEVARLRVEYPHKSNVELARMFGKSAKSVVSKAHALGLSKTRQHRARMSALNVELRRDRS